MSKSYDEIMARLTVTDDMRERVLRNAEQAAAQPRSKVIPIRRRWTHFTAAAACFVLIAAGVTAVGTRMLWSAGSSSSASYDMAADSEEAAAGVPEEDGMVGGEAFGMYASAEELSEAAGFTVTDLTGLPFEPQESWYYLLSDDLAEIDYLGEENSLYYRVSSVEGDISGDYIIYTDENVVTIDDVTVTLREDDGGCIQAIWNDDGYAYSISLEVSVSEEEFTALVESAINQ